MYKSVAELPEFVGTAWRAESGYGHAPGTTVADIIRFEREELGNDYPDISDKLLQNLDQYSAFDAVWVNRRRKDCLWYLSEGESEEAVGRVHLPKGSKIITPDYCGGYLVLRGQAEPMLKKGGNPVPSTESERLSFHEREEIRFDRPRTWLVRNRYVTDSPWQEVEAYSDKEACEKSGIPFEECWARLKGEPIIGIKDNPVDLSKNMLCQIRPATPLEGPPLPRALGIRWPWRKP